MAYSDTDIMHDDGKGVISKLIITNDSVFLNSKCLFIEYNDVIGVPMLFMTWNMKHSDVYRKIFDFSPVDSDRLIDCYEWYVHRKFINPLMCLKVNEEFFKQNFGDKTEFQYREWCDSLMWKELQSHPELYTDKFRLAFSKVVSLAKDQTNLINDIVFYSEVEVPGLVEDAKKISNSIRVVTGDLIEVVKNIPNDSTFVFSDVTKILSLYAADKLRLASVILADRYDYNYLGRDVYHPNEDRYVIDLEKLQEDCLFKFDKCSNSEI